VHKTCID